MTDASDRIAFGLSQRNHELWWAVDWEFVNSKHIYTWLNDSMKYSWQPQTPLLFPMKSSGELTP